MQMVRLFQQPAFRGMLGVRWQATAQLARNYMSGLPQYTAACIIHQEVIPSASLSSTAVHTQTST